jgi:hypothetical protein
VHEAHVLLPASLESPLRIHRLAQQARHLNFITMRDGGIRLSAMVSSHRDNIGIEGDQYVPMKFISKDPYWL